MLTHLQTLAWQGFSLQVPRDWNLTLHRGNAKLGAITLSDLRQSQLEIRWQTLSPARLTRHTNRLLQRLKRHSIQALSFPSDSGIHQTHRIEQEEVTILLLQSHSRLYELAGQRASPELSSIISTFRDHTTHAPWPWQLYGISGIVPAHYRLKKATLLPGRAQLDFTAFRRRITLGSWSLADRLLANRPLRSWAAGIPLVKNHPTGQWQSHDTEERFTITRGKVRPTHTILSLIHVPAENLIRWQQTTT